MRISFYLDNKDISTTQIDCSKLLDGNPGIGGTHYEILLIANYLQERNSDFTISILSTNKKMIDNPIAEILQISSLRDAFLHVEKNYYDVIIVPYHYQLIEILSKLKLKINIIVWTHNFFSYSEAELLYKSECIKKIIFVGRQQYDKYIDHNIIKKGKVIFNCIPYQLEDITIKRDNNVVYMGSITRPKGFHLLAKQWSKVVKHVPDAKLFIIGSGSLYKKNIKLGKYNIAEEEYEKEFIKYLLDKKGNISNSVKFLGTIGSEKSEVLKKSKVGVANPIGKSETFCLSAVEMESYGIPVVSINNYSLPDVVKNNFTGLLYYNKLNLWRYIVKLLIDDNLNNKLSNNCIDYVNKRFSLDIILPVWRDLLISFNKENMLDSNEKIKNYLNMNKFLRLLIIKIRKMPLCKKMPPLIFFEDKFDIFKSVIKMKIRKI